MRISNARIAAAIFTLAATVLLFFHGQRMVATNDEGIILEAAQRMTEGQRLYTDFFGYMSPGSYWLQAAVFQAAGFALWTGRLIVILDFAAQCALLFWLTAWLASRRTATAVALAFAGFQMSDPSFLTSTHRLDSATLVLAALCLAIRGLGPPGRWTPDWLVWPGVGALLAAAAWCTPSMALLAPVVIAWLGLAPERRRRILPLTAGAAAVGLAGMVVLAAGGSFAAFLAQMAWLRENYSGVNVMPYGSVIGGYAALFQDTQGGSEFAVRGLLVACLALPAILPPAGLTFWGVALWRGAVDGKQRAALYLLLPATAALVATAFPRADMMHLAFIAAVPYALAGAAAGRLAGRAGPPLAVVTILLAALFSANFFRGWWEGVPLASPVGRLLVPRNDRGGMQGLLAAVRPGDSLYVHPYAPVFYFLTQARNPTRFSYLAPGMMTRTEEAAALAELQNQPPRWLLFLELSPAEFLRVFPNAESGQSRFARIEHWLKQNYRPVSEPAVTVAGYRLWRRVAATGP